MSFISPEDPKEFPHIFHEHPLVNGVVLSPIICNGCGEYIQDLCYGCRSCQEFHLHESCFELPHELQHPMHDKHRLILRKTPPYDNGTCICAFCGDKHRKWFFYHCPVCKFDIHFKCALLPLTIKAELHDHPLTLFRKLITFNCDICGKDGKSMPYLCSNINCGLGVHHHCASLPRIIKHIRHKHPLNFTNSIESDDFEHRLCQLCVKKVDTNCGVYLCSICDYATHLDCASDEKGRDVTFMQESNIEEPIESTTTVEYEDWGLDKFTNKLSYVVKDTKVGEDKIEIPIQINHSVMRSMT